MARVLALEGLSAFSMSLIAIRLSPLISCLLGVQAAPVSDPGVGMSQNDESLGTLGAPSADRQVRIQTAVGVEAATAAPGGMIRSARTVYSVRDALRM